MNLSLAQRIDMLFRALHSPDDGEPTADSVAEAVRDRGVAVSGTDLTALRTGAVATASAELLAALADHFNQGSWYLTEPGDSRRVIDTYVQLDLLRALREAGVRRVRLRGRPATSDRQALTESLRSRQQRGQEPSRGGIPSGAADPA